MAKKDERFIITEKDGGTFSSKGDIRIIVDKQTGVNYMWITSGYAGGLTPLLDAAGKPIITKIYEE